MNISPIELLHAILKLELDIAGLNARLQDERTALARMDPTDFFYPVAQDRAEEIIKKLTIERNTKQAAVQDWKHRLEETHGPDKKQRLVVPKQKQQDLSQYLDDPRFKFTETERDYLSLQYEFGMKISAIAKIRGRHHSSVQEVLRRALQKMESAKRTRPANGGSGVTDLEEEILNRIDAERNTRRRTVS